MKNTRFTNTLLGIITINLTLITLIQMDIFNPKAYSDKNTTMPLNTNYGLVPINEDGSINVNIISSSAIIDVNLEQLRGEKCLKLSGDSGNILSVSVVEL